MQAASCYTNIRHVSIAATNCLITIKAPTWSSSMARSFTNAPGLLRSPNTRWQTRNMKSLLSVHKLHTRVTRWDDITRVDVDNSRLQYLFNNSMNYFDLAVDENAIWVMFHYEEETFVSVAKIDVNNLTIYDVHNLTMIQHENVANGFVVCGVLYVVCLLLPSKQKQSVCRSKVRLSSKARSWSPTTSIDSAINNQTSNGSICIATRTCE